ncbi:MAG: hypothetical protein WBM44_21135 [Waterburya sp.]
MTQSAQKLQQFRSKAYQLLGRAKDATFDLMDAVLVTRNIYSFAELSLSPVFRRKWPSLYEALDETWGLPAESIEIDEPTWGRVEIQRWTQFHFYHSPDQPMEIILIQRQGKGLSKKTAKPMWLAWIGLEKLSLESLWQHCF